MINIIGYVALYFFIGFIFAQGWAYCNPNNEVVQLIEMGGDPEGARVFIFLFWWIYLSFTLFQAIEFILKWTYNIFIYNCTNDEDRML